MWLCDGVLLAPSPSPLGEASLLFCSVPCGWEHDSRNVLPPAHSMQVGHVSQMLGVPFRMVDMKRGEYNTLEVFLCKEGN